MREILGFIRWCFSGLELWQWSFIASMGFQIASLFADETARVWLNGLGLAIILGFLIKWVLWDSVRRAWGRYKQERNQLFSVIKDS
jgi:hypothetical protein